MMGKLKTMFGLPKEVTLFGQKVKLTPLTVKDMALLEGISENSTTNEQIKMFKPIAVKKLQEAFPNETENWGELYDELPVSKFIELQKAILQVSEIEAVNVPKVKR